MILGREKVVEARLRVEVLLEHEHPLLSHQIAHFTRLIEQVAELARSDRADLDAGGVPPLAHAVDTESAFLHDPSRPWAVAEVVGLRVELLG